MTTQPAELMDLTKISNTFPQRGDKYIPRDNMMMTLVEMLQTDTEVVLVEGPDGIGKTTLLAQFAQEHPHHTFGLFVRSSSRWAYDSEMLTRELSDMIGWVLKKEKFRDTEKELDPSQLLRSYIFDLQKQANKEHETYYFVVDGLDEIPEEDHHERDTILDLLPFGLPRFRFILSGNLDCLKKRSQKIAGVNSFRLPGFTFEETTQFLDDLISDPAEVETIHKISKHVPGNLASVRRLLLAGTQVDKLLDELPERLPDLFELEWRMMGQDDELLRKALAILAFDQRRHSLESLSKLCKTELAKLSEKLAGCSFLEMRNNGQEIEYVHDTFRRFAITRLNTLRELTLETIISDLFTTPESADSLAHLPEFLHQAKRYEDLLTYLSPEHIGRLIDCGDSWVPLHQKADLGVDTALLLERDGDLLRFSIQRAMITSMESSEPWRSEIEAYIALDDFSAPYTLAQRMVTKEDRLHLLSVIARAKKTRSLPVEVELIDQIQQLYKTLDRSNLGDRGLEIAADLLYTHPELAVELVQDCTDKEGADDSLDLALAKLSFKTLTAGSKEMTSTQQTLRDKVKDPKIQRYMDTVALFFGEYSAEGVITEVKKWEKPADQIFALRAWTMTNAKREDAASVIEYGLTTIIKTTTYTASAKVYHELAFPLIYIPDLKQVIAIINRLDGLKGPIESAGPTTEYVKLQATMAEAEARYDIQASFNRLQDLFFYTDILTETDTKLSALADIASVLKRIDQAEKFAEMGPIHELVVEELKTVVDDILIKTANHYQAVRPAIKALAQSDTKIALEVVLKLNTPPRREEGLVTLIEAISTEPPSVATFAAMTETYGHLKSAPMKALAARIALRCLLDQKKKMGPFIDKIMALYPWMNIIPDADEKCHSICMMLEILLEHKDPTSNKLINSLSQQDLVKTWETIDLGWAKVNAGFKIVSVMAKCSPDLSHAFLDKTIKARNEIVLDCQDLAFNYIGCVRMTIRCFSGLIKRKLYNQDDLEIIQDLIDKIPALGVRLTAWADLALKFFITHDQKKHQEIVSNRIRPFLERDIIEDQEARMQTIIAVAPALYCAHHASAKQLIDTLPQPYRDNAYERVCSFLITRQLPTEPYDPERKPREKIKYVDFLDAFEVLQSLETEPFVCGHVTTLVDNIRKHFRREFSKAQQADILLKLRDLTKEKFTNLDYIKHEGYKILTEAQIVSLEQHNKGAWNTLAQRARAISNLADKALVLIGIAEAMPIKENANAILFMQEAKKIIPQIPIFDDRISRYEYLAKVSAETDKGLSKECLRQAWQETLPMDPDDVPKVRRSIIDFAHRLDPEFAATLAAESDNDPGREFARAQTKQRLELLKTRERLANGEQDAFKTKDYTQQADVAQMMLASLNSNRTNTLHFELTRKYIKQASKMNLQDAYAMLSWIIENAVLRHSDTDQAKTLIRSLFQATHFSAELTFKIAQRIRSVTDLGISAARQAVPTDVNLIHRGEREKALQIIKNWATNATGFIKITDPYFGLEELEIVKELRSTNPSIPIFILTSRKHQQNIQQPWDDTYQSHWRMKVSDSDPGEVTITLVGTASNGEHPIHDRWWLTEKNGLRLGTSVNSLGLGKLSEISQLDEQNTAAKTKEIDRYLEGTITNSGSDRLRYLSFKL